MHIANGKNEVYLKTNSPLYKSPVDTNECIFKIDEDFFMGRHFEKTIKIPERRSRQRYHINNRFDCTCIVIVYSIVFKITIHLRFQYTFRMLMDNTDP